MNDADSTPKLHIDADWKAEAQREKERLSEKEKVKSAPDSEEMPPADFRSVIGMLAQQALMGLGMMGDQKTGRVIVDLVGSKFYIDLLLVLEEKTRGNLADDEKAELNEVLRELQGRFVQLAKLVAEQGATMPISTSPVQPDGGLHLHRPDAT